MKKALLIVNPVSGTLKTRESLFDVIDVLTARGILPTVVFTRRKGHGRQLAAKASPQKYDCLICCGGDGTLNEVIAGKLDSGSPLPIGYIPAGSTNDFASGLGLPLDLPAAAADIAKALKSGKTVFSDIGKFGDDRYFTYIASFGAFTASSYNAPQAVKNLFGHLAYVFEGIKDFFQISPVHAVCVADGKKHEGDYVFGGICNTYSVGGIVKLSDDCVDISDGQFETVLIRAPRDLSEFNSIVTAVMTSDLNCDMIEFFKASELEFRFPSDSVWTLDGEKAECSDYVSVRNVCRAVPLLHIPRSDRK